MCARWANLCCVQGDGLKQQAASREGPGTAEVRATPGGRLCGSRAGALRPVGRGVWPDPAGPGAGNGALGSSVDGVGSAGPFPPREHPAGQAAGGKTSQSRRQEGPRAGHPLGQGPRGPREGTASWTAEPWSWEAGRASPSQSARGQRPAARHLEQQQSHRWSLGRQPSPLPRSRPQEGVGSPLSTAPHPQPKYNLGSRLPGNRDLRQPPAGAGGEKVSVTGGVPGGRAARRGSCECPVVKLRWGRCVLPGQLGSRPVLPRAGQPLPSRPLRPRDGRPQEGWGTPPWRVDDSPARGALSLGPGHLLAPRGDRPPARPRMVARSLPSAQGPLPFRAPVPSTPGPPVCLPNPPTPPGSSELNSSRPHPLPQPQAAPDGQGGS